MLKLLTAIMEPEFFQKLRTEKHLAYSLNVSYIIIESCLGLFVYIESPGYDVDHLIDHTEEFLEKFVQYLAVYPLDKFNSTRDSLDRVHKQSVTLPTSVPTLYQEELEFGTYRFHEMATEIEPFKSITLTMLREFYKQLTGKETRRAVLLQKEEPKIQPEEIRKLLKELKWGKSSSKSSLGERMYELVMEYYTVPPSDHRNGVKGNMENVTDCAQFKQHSQFLPDAWKEGEERLQLFAFQLIKQRLAPNKGAQLKDDLAVPESDIMATTKISY